MLTLTRDQRPTSKLLKEKIDEFNQELVPNAILIVR